MTGKTIRGAFLGLIAAMAVSWVYKSVYNTGGLPRLPLPSQRPSAEDVQLKSEDTLRSSVRGKIGKDVRVTNYTLVHKTGGEYTGVATISTSDPADGAQQVSVDVTVDDDGRYLVRWEGVP
jgi:hypothetical protein